MVMTMSAPAVASAAHSVYVANYDRASVTTFAVGAGGGTTQQGGSVPTATAADAGAAALAMTPDGRYLYAANFFAGTLQAFSVGAGGKLTALGTAIPSSSGMAGTDSPASLAVSPNGQYLYVANFSGEVAQFAIAASGGLTLQGTTISGTCCASESTAIAITPNGQFVYVANSEGGTVSTFTVGAGGALTQQGTGVATGSGQSSRPWSLAVSPNGDYLFVANRGQGTVSTFTIGAGGALTQVGTGFVSGRAGSGVFALAVSPNGNNLYAANSGQSTVSTFTIGAGGVLTQQGTGSLTMGRRGSYPDGVAVSPDGRDLYAVNGRFNTVTTFAIGSGGKLRRQLIVDTGGSPDAVVVSPAQAAAPVAAEAVSVAGDRELLSTPPPSVCQGAGGALMVSVKVTHADSHGGYRPVGAIFYIDARHVATATKLPATEELSLAHETSGSHTLTVKLTVRFGDRGSRVQVGRTAKLKFTVCPLG
jgi:6-phosphogluconolactonase (cycloisomerase 2 family)